MARDRNRGLVFPYELALRLTEEMGERLEQYVKDNPGKTRVGVIRDVLEKSLPKSKKKGK